MLQHLKNLKIVALLFFFTSSLGMAQEKKTQLYFLADTVTMNKEKRMLAIKNDIEITYTFFCKCVLPNEGDIVFSFFNNKQGRASSSIKPTFNYISWKDLYPIAMNGPVFFNKKFELFITEVLPNQQYRTNKVRFVRNVEPLINTQQIKQ